VAVLAGLPRSRRLVLDAGAILALAEGDGDARATIARARREGYGVVVPMPVIAQVHRGGRDHARVDRVLNAVDETLPTSEATARRAGELLGLAATDDAIDGIVAAEALAAAPAVILTSDRPDLRRLLESQPDGRRVAIIGV
jgi:regulator of protease activity HflC (stomatin/prohibitin superfamily)